MTFDQLPINIFDLIVLVVLILGIVRGRKHGMSEELLLLVKWLAVLFACAFLYEPVGAVFAQESPFSLLSSYLIVYVGAGLLILGAFALVKHGLGGKLLGSDVFGRSEYYLGMGSGMIRYACMLLAAMALLNARYFSPKQVHAMTAFQQDVYGSEFFPTLHSAQAIVFERSLTGSWIRGNLGFLLIKPTQSETKELHQREANVLY
jgi:uncharacterized membrane protein required for colicin V production